MPAKKMRVEVYDEDGNRYNITFEGKVTREKALCLLDIVELLSGMHDKQELKNSIASGSKFDKTKTVAEKHFPFAWFSSKEILAAYEQEFDEAISLSTVSTYLARMVDRGVLARRGLTYNMKYQMITRLAQNSLRIMKNK